MRVESSVLSMSASHSSTRVEQERLSIQIRTGGPARPPVDRLELSFRPPTPPADEPLADGVAGADDCDACELAEHIRNDPRLALLVALVEKMTGCKIEVIPPGVAKRIAAGETDLPGLRLGQRAAVFPEGGPQITIEGVRRVAEAEDTTVSIRGSVVTADGTRHDVSVELAMSRRFVEETRFGMTFGAPPMTDPLVLTFEGALPEFQGGTARFDLDLDGTTDIVRLTSGASAMLWYDRDGDGRITDGSELFGPRTGDGFAELAALDTDGNGWIDSSDAAFAKLRLVTGDGAGGKIVRTLAEAGVGAISTASVRSPFTLMEGSTVFGQIQATGLVLLDHGAPAVIQHVDLVV